MERDPQVHGPVASASLYFSTRNREWGDREAVTGASCGMLGNLLTLRWVSTSPDAGDISIVPKASG